MPSTRNATTGKSGGSRPAITVRTTIDSPPAPKAIGSEPGGLSLRRPSFST
jgi:hypothetical protein